MTSEDRITREAWEEILKFPIEFVSGKDIRVLMYFREFHNVLKFNEPKKILSIIEKQMADDNVISFILTSSSINAFRSILEDGLSGKNTDKISFLPLEEKAVVDAITKGFLRVGRVAEQNQAVRIYELLDGHPWYIWQLADLTFNRTKGYLNDAIIDESMHSLLSLHDVRFRDIMSNLSNFQIQYLHAIFDGKARTCNREMIRLYHLNSAANVHRLREALAKKEVVSFDEQDFPYIIDPLFKIWLGKYYFK